MRIITHPLHLFTLFSQDSEMMEWAFKRFLEVTRNSVVLNMPLVSHDYEHLSLRNKRLYDTYKTFFEFDSKLYLQYPEIPTATENRQWNYPWQMDELLMNLPEGEEIIFCGGYVENCLPRSMGAFYRNYGSFCLERNMEIRIDEHRSFCASATHTQEALFLDTRSGNGATHSRNEFQWWLRTSQYDR